jgi:hypothetical protein
MSRLGYEEDDDQNTGVEEQDQTEHTEEGEQNVEITEPQVRVVEETQDQRIAAEAGDEHEEEQDESQGRRRETAKERRARAKAAKERDKQELDLLRATVAKQADRQSQIERELVVTRITDIDNRLATAAQEAQTFDNIFAKAITAKNGEDAAEAQRLANDAKVRWNQLKQNRDQLAKVLENGGQQQQEKPYAGKAREWLQKNSWYNPASGDEDSLIAEAIDKALMKKMNPESPEYWTTLTQKVRERLPHRFGRSQTTQQDDPDDDGDDDDVAPVRTETRRRGPPTGGSSRTNSGRGGPSEIRLPREMVEAMKEAGHWNDPKQRERVAKRYLESIKNSRTGG